MKIFSLCVLIQGISAFAKFQRKLYKSPTKRKKKKGNKNEKLLTGGNKKQWRSELCIVENGSGFNMGGSNYFVQCNVGYCASSSATIVTCTKGTGFTPPFECSKCVEETTTSTTQKTKPIKPTKPSKPAKPTKPEKTTTAETETIPGIPTIPATTETTGQEPEKPSYPSVTAGVGLPGGIGTGLFNFSLKFDTDCIILRG